MGGLHENVSPNDSIALTGAKSGMNRGPADSCHSDMVPYSDRKKHISDMTVITIGRSTYG